MELAARVEIDGADPLVAPQSIDRSDAVLVRAGNAQYVDAKVVGDLALGLEL